jgi:EVE domain
MNHWLAVASAQHVRIGRAQGFCQVNHGKSGPLQRMQAGDRIAYYSPTDVFGDKVPYRHFTAIGTIRPGAPYQGVMAGDFTPFRRDVDWDRAQETPIAPLLDQLDFTKDNRNWGYQLRFGLFPISAHDMALIGVTMGATSN